MKDYERLTRKEIWFWLAGIEEVGSARLKKLLEVFTDIEELYYASEIQLTKLENMTFPKKILEKLIFSRDTSTIKKSFAAIEQKNIRFTTQEEDEYPKHLRQLYDAPSSLFYRGLLPDNRVPAIAVIGARNCSNYGKEIAVCFSKILSENGIQIVSGMARGIDGFAHEGAFLGGTPTFGVLGQGIDLCYPKENYRIYNEFSLPGKGGLISEYLPGTKALKHHFPQRNRIISGLSDGVLVVEAAEKSGTLITVSMALEQGKNIYVIPGRIGDRLSQGCLRLLAAGAKLVLEPGDILEDFSYETMNLSGFCKNEKKKFALETQEEIVYACLDLHPKHIETIVLESRFEIDQLAEILVSLELKDCIRQTTKNFYAKVLDV